MAKRHHWLHKHPDEPWRDFMPSSGEENMNRFRIRNARLLKERSTMNGHHFQQMTMVSQGGSLAAMKKKLRMMRKGLPGNKNVTSVWWTCTRCGVNGWSGLWSDLNKVTRGVKVKRARVEAGVCHKQSANNLRQWVRAAQRRETWCRKMAAAKLSSDDRSYVDGLTKYWRAQVIRCQRSLQGQMDEGLPSAPCL